MRFLICFEIVPCRLYFSQKKKERKVLLDHRLIRILDQFHLKRKQSGIFNSSTTWNLSTSIYFEFLSHELMTSLVFIQSKNSPNTHFNEHFTMPSFFSLDSCWGCYWKYTNMAYRDTRRRISGALMLSTFLPRRRNKTLILICVWKQSNDSLRILSLRLWCRDQANEIEREEFNHFMLLRYCSVVVVLMWSLNKLDKTKQH